MIFEITSICLLPLDFYIFQKVLIFLIFFSKLRKRNIQEEVESHNMEVIVDNSAANSEAQLPRFDIKHVSLNDDYILSTFNLRSHYFPIYTYEFK